MTCEELALAVDATCVCAPAWVWYASAAARAVGSWELAWRRAIWDAEDCRAACASFGDGMSCSPVLIESEPFACASFREVAAASGARLRFCMTEADMTGDAADIELTVMAPIYCSRSRKETAGRARYCAAECQASMTALMPSSAQRSDSSSTYVP